MGKFKKYKPIKLRNVPLEQQLCPEQQNKNRLKTRNKCNNEDEKFIGSNLSGKILQQARKQQEELEDEIAETNLRKINALIEEDIDTVSDDENTATNEEKELYENIVIDQEDEKALEKFMNNNPAPRLTLADIINEKITEKKTEIQSVMSETSVNVKRIDSEVEEMFKEVGNVLARYRAGKIPKAFKIVPKLSNWEEILYITEPTNWSAASVYMATRIFASNLKGNMAQRFYNLILLPRVRDDITEYKRLNFHLYQSLKKALFKPAAFMKGIILPLCESGTCTLREAVIIGSVLQKNSVPMLHSAAAIMKIAEMDYNGASSIFLRILYDKKYALPYKVIDASVFHFLRFQRDKRELPVLWHQALLTFVQRYKDDISSEQKDALLGLLRHQTHPTITKEIRRELQNAQCRDIEITENMNIDD